MRPRALFVITAISACRCGAAIGVSVVVVQTLARIGTSVVGIVATIWCTLTQTGDPAVAGWTGRHIGSSDESNPSVAITSVTHATGIVTTSRIRHRLQIIATIVPQIAGAINHFGIDKDLARIVV